MNPVKIPIRAFPKPKRYQPRRTWIQIAPLFLILAVAGTLSTALAQKVSVVLIVADGFEWNDASLHQKAKVETPHIDSIGREGVRADRYILTEPGSGSLIALLTGRYPISTVLPDPDGESDHAQVGFDFKDPVMGHVFKKNDYRTGWLGRWPFASNGGTSPKDLGFDTSSRTAEEEGSAEPSKADGAENPRRTSHDLVKEKNSQLVTEFGRFLENARSEESGDPFLAVIAPLSYRAVDSVPKPVGEELRKRLGADAPEWELRRAASAAETDRTVGGILDVIGSATLKDEPLILFTSAGSVAAGGRQPWLDEGQEGIDEGGSRVPLFIKGKWIASGKMIVPPIADIDILPSLKTFCSLLLDESDSKYEGLSMAALAYGLPMKWRNRSIFQFDRESGDIGAIRTLEWRAVRSPEENSDWRLYHMFIDPEQNKDVASEHKEEVSAFTSELKEAYLKRAGR